MAHDPTPAQHNSDPLELSPRQAHRACARGATLVDIRDAEERALGWAEDSRSIPASVLRQRCPDPPVILLCARGVRSLAMAREMAASGIEGVHSVAGGLQAWQEAGLPVAYPDGIDAQAAGRYARQLVLPEVGPGGQRRLGRARVTLVGAGGLGSPAALYLAAAGVGHLRVVDHDTVARSNLHRQILYTDVGVGQAKADSAAARLVGLNPDVNVEAVSERLQSGNVERLLQDSDVVVDGSDNFPTRYLVSDACLKLARPLVYGAVMRFEGQASVFDPASRRGVNPCYRCLFPEPPDAADAPNCATAGVLGVLPGLVGMVQATETLKLLLGLGETLVGRLLRIDAAAMRFRESAVRADADCAWCAPGKPFPGYVDYEAFCSD